VFQKDRKSKEEVVGQFIELEEQFLESFPDEWDEESLQRAKEANTLEQTREVYNSSRPGSEAMTLALDKWEIFSTKESLSSRTYGAAYTAYCRSPKGTMSMVMALQAMWKLQDQEDISVFEKKD